MRILNSICLFSALTVSTMTVIGAAQAADPAGNPAQAGTMPIQLADSGGAITILSPQDGTVLDRGSGNKLEYNISLSPTGNHIHVYVDDQDPIIARKVSGCPCSINLPELSSGKHTIVIKEATASHALTGVQAIASITVK